MAVHIYDVTVSDVAALIGHLSSISSTTSPSSSEVSEWIKQVAAQVNAQFRAIGYVPSTITSLSTGADLELYYQSRSAIAKYVAARWHNANRLGDTDLAISYRIQFDQWLERLRQDKQGTTGSDNGISFRSNLKKSNARSSSWSRGRSYK